jgi:hypothetical protein
MANANRIVLSSKYGRRFEDIAEAADLKPGMALTRLSTGKVDQYTGGLGHVEGVKVAIEDALNGKDIGTAYAAGDTVPYIIPLPGDTLQILVKDGQTIAVGDKLRREALTGLWIEVADADTDVAQFEAIEAVSPSGADDHVACICIATS